MRTLLRLGRRYLLRHAWQSALMVLGITLGVAVATAIDLANASAGRAFELSTETVAGKATHQIVGGPQGLDEAIYTRLRRAGRIEAAAPVLAQYVSSPQLGDRPLQLLGVDPLAEPPFRSYLGDRQGGSDSSRPAPPTANLTTFLTRPGAMLISSSLGARYGLDACQGDPNATPPACQITLMVAGRPRPAWVAGLVEPADALSRRALDGLILADIATAQELTDRLGVLDRIDLILPDSLARLTAPEQAAALGLTLPAGARIQPVEARTGTIAQMSSAFQLNLTALSLLALVVGLFLIYNTMTFSVVQRRRLFGILRSLGVTRQEIFILVIAEALLVGALGAGLGIGLGILMGQGAVRMVTQTINDLFFLLTVRGVQVPASSLVKGALLGIGGALLSAAPPAWEAASVPPGVALSRSGLETKAQGAVRLAAWGGSVLGLAGVGLLLLPTRSLVISFTGTFSVVIGIAMLAPLFTRLLMRLATPLLGRGWGALGRMAPRNVIRALSRTSIAVSALMVAVSVTIGVSVMVNSFRHTVIAWLGQTLQGDIYLSVPGAAANQTSIPIDPQVLAVLNDTPGVRRVLVLRSVQVDSPGGPVNVAASSNPEVSQERSFLRADAALADIPGRMAAGAVIVSEPFANRYNLPRRGAHVTLFTDRGPHDFPVVGVYSDYASTQGTVTLLLDVYRQYWDDPAVTAAALRLAPGEPVDPLVQRLESQLNPIQQLLIRPNQVLRDEVLVVFDRTFAITGALQLLTTVVAFIGVLSALLSLELERQRELGILRAVGLTVRQLWGLVMLETGLLGAVAGLLSMPTGYVLALILVYIINRRSFGWTLQMQVLPGPFLLALAVAVGAALLAGIYPARRMGKMVASEALRSE